MLYDTHAHLDLIKDLDRVIKNARASNVGIIIAQSVDIKSMKKGFDISKKYPEIVKFSAGLYPENSLKIEDYYELEEFVMKNKEDVFAIGEIGMDFTPQAIGARCKVQSARRGVQEEVFRRQLELAEKLNLPVSIHTRKAEKEVVEILKGFPNVKKILHCFSGNLKLAKRAEEIGCYFSIPTNIVRSEHFKKIVGVISKDRILTETDSPYLSPFKGEWNEPCNIRESVRVLADIWCVCREEAELKIEENFKRLFEVRAMSYGP
jgi:TatD DNase family protein